MYKTAETIGQVADTPTCTVQPEVALRKVVEALAANEAALAVVMQGGTIEGVVSEGDIIRAIHDGADLETIWAADVMTTDLVKVNERTAAWDVLELMLAERIRHVIVEREAGPGVVGFFNVVDLVLPR